MALEGANWGYISVSLHKATLKLVKLKLLNNTAADKIIL